MKSTKLLAVGAVAALAIGGLSLASNAKDGEMQLAADVGHAGHAMHATVKGVPANKALAGVPMAMSPDQLPAQFRTQLRGDSSSAHGTATLKQVGNDVEYTFVLADLTSPIISAHFHNAPHTQVGVRAQSICGVAGESPSCPTGTSATISGVWKNADIAAFNRGDITIAFHTEVYPAPIGELAVYIPAADL